MQKEAYEALEIETVVFEADDVITTSKYEGETIIVGGNARYFSTVEDYNDLFH